MGHQGEVRALPFRNVNVGGYHCSILRTTIQIVVVLLYLSMLSWHATGMSLDPHWCTSWLLAWGGFAVLVGWKQVRLTSLKHWLAGLVVLLMVFALGWQASPEALLMHVTCWTTLWTAPVGEARWLNGVQRVAPWFAATLLLVLLGHALVKMGTGGWSHQESYHLPLPWAHRNIAFESLAFLVMLVGLKRGKTSLLFLSLLALTAFVYQVRGVLLVCAAWGALMAWDQTQSRRWVRRLAIATAGVFVLLQVAWNLVPAEERVMIFVHVPDVLKTLDVGYNLKSATSSSERGQIWAWTLGDVSAIGGGSGSWKWAAEGHLQERIGKCDVSVRRAHSDLLQWLHELGWLPALVMLLLAWRQMWQVRMFFFLALPLLCFTFPTERAEIVVPMALLFWSLQPRGKPLSVEQGSGQGRSLLLATALALVTLGGVWNLAQHTLGQVLRGQIGLAALNEVQRKCIDWFPSDAAMNHIDVLLALHMHGAGEHEAAQAMACEVLAARPHSLTAMKALWSMGERGEYLIWDCSEFSTMQLKLPCP